MAKKKQIIKTYRDLEYYQVADYADKEGLNIDTPENYKEASQSLFKQIQTLFKQIQKQAKMKSSKKKKEQGFSISIKGAGTKKEIIESLQVLIDVIASMPTSELADGFEDESGTLVTKTDTFESYTGYKYEKEKKVK